ncbi:hypothetical protein RvY_05436 [Ramazzottius varieornatus]|uniref:Integrase zinc-binding domain-containing protein n=1 Tax=Ramazzottius varieornatus TaxID=947166 RepID=A0A1D1UYM2_RAMVA|nr:hypothetical protein RvY_05436 [Ramazzottius varieornatus]
MASTEDGTNGPETIGEVLSEVNESQFTTAPTCLVLTEDVQKVFAKGDPLIVGTSMSDIQTFFQKVIAEAQLGMETTQSTSAGSFPLYPSRNRKAEIATFGRRAERYPIPYSQYQAVYRKKDEGTKRAASRKEGASSASAKTDTGDDDNERSEIPLDAIKYYLAEKKYFPGWGTNSKRNLRKRCDDFSLEDGILFYKTKKGRKVQCVEDRAERMRLIWQQHSIDHRRRDRLFNALKQNYYWKGMLLDINRVLDSCEFCARTREEKSVPENVVTVEFEMPEPVPVAPRSSDPPLMYSTAPFVNNYNPATMKKPVPRKKKKTSDTVEVIFSDAGLPGSSSGDA